MERNVLIKSRTLVYHNVCRGELIIVCSNHLSQIESLKLSVLWVLVESGPTINTFEICYPRETSVDPASVYLGFDQMKERAELAVVVIPPTLQEVKSGLMGHASPGVVFNEAQISQLELRILKPQRRFEHCQFLRLHVGAGDMDQPGMTDGGEVHKLTAFTAREA